MDELHCSQFDRQQTNVRMSRIDHRRSVGLHFVRCLLIVPYFVRELSVISVKYDCLSIKLRRVGIKGLK